MTVSDCKIIQLPRIADTRGKLSFIESHDHVPFDIKRIYYLYDMPPDAERGAHGHKKLEQLIVPLAGSFDICFDDGYHKKSYRLENPWEGVYVAPMIWRELKNFSSGAICLVLASEHYDEQDYFRNYHEFLHAAGTQ